MLEAEKTPVIVLLEGLGQLKIKLHHLESNPQPSGL
jgi:hypothetical protein